MHSPCKHLHPAFTNLMLILGRLLPLHLLLQQYLAPNMSAGHYPAIPEMVFCTLPTLTNSAHVCTIPRHFSLSYDLGQSIRSASFVCLKM